ncbi:hypothetical protein O6H91_17G014100 [Diphasiastrum complanatum]|uniref:Uncharacterized protein n=1 Tax=Diphasiastrum complanatum TaxID=34168 RepID=A0ACC2B487_DIPCM|nr:hypothetical protein O6H91_Y514300 [Diphasiastrum complanatum]KAJ7524608.1 hypothetical protein O6H91_17G014100 [Diphasiastrum complanatum]
MSSEGIAKRSRDEKKVTGTNQDDASERRSVQAKGRRGMGRGVKSLLVAVSIPLILGILDAMINRPDDWYKDLRKPSWNPPAWLLSTVWCVIYPVMGLASWLVWADGGIRKNPYPLTLFMTQLVLSLLWPIFFFGLHMPALALLDICLLLVTLFLCYNAFHPVNHVASDLLIPYVAWILFASALNFSIWNLNHSDWNLGTRYHVKN